MEWFLLAWKRGAEFSGRSRRKEYWMFQLFNCLIVLLLLGFAFLLGGESALKFVTNCCFAYCVIAFVPSLAVTVRRLHDIGKSGWWYFIGFVPLIGAIILFVFTLLDSDPDRNEYGPNPKVPGYANVVI
ncbi:MAG TPA: DUF805 domain-containing protein [Terracidiphilus sp.]|jgi:uncharacterized membrane protein YhaH (DUF805 family)